MQNLIAAAKLDANALDVRASQVLLAPLVCELWEELADAETSYRKLELGIGAEIAVLADPALIRQALANVVENAIKFSPRGSAVTIDAEERGGRVVLRVRDRGLGAPPATLARLFERFYRAPNAGEGGTGLGLYIARSFVESQGGHICASVPADGGAGLTVALDLPSARSTRP